MSAAATTERKFLGLNLWQWVLVAMVAGIIVGMIFGEAAGSLMVLGTIFFKLIKMVVAPLIFLALISGITSLTEGKNFARIAFRGTFAYLATAVAAVLIGIFMAEVAEPGVGVTPAAGGTSPLGEATAPPELGAFFLDLIPANIISAMAADHYLQIVVFSIFTGVVMNNIRGEVTNVKVLIQEASHIVFKMIEWVVATAPLAVFGFMAWMVGVMGFDAITSLMGLFVLVVLACFSQLFVFGAFLAFIARLNPFIFYKKIFGTQLVAFSTSSSKATMTTAMRNIQDRMGVSISTSNFMMPLGACINMDGTAIYLGICSVFFAQMFGIDLDWADYGVLAVTCTLGSIGAAGIPSGSILFMGMVLASVGIPMEAIGMILGIDRLLDMFRTTVNVTGDAAITIVIDATEGTLDRDLYNDPTA